MDIQGITTLRDAQADEVIGMTRGGNRYGYDESLEKGWEQYDTNQDAWYFGVWVHPTERKVFTYAEGDRILEIANSEHAFVALLQYMNSVYGKMPPIAVGFDSNGKPEFHAPRPGDSTLAQGA
jgi:hypothetical protein